VNQRIILIIVILAEVLFSNFSKVSKYDGVYRYGDPFGEGPNGQVIIFEESDSSLLFYIDISLGSPSYNMGTLYDRIVIKDGKGVFLSREFENNKSSCKWSFTFSKKILTVATIGNNYECGFGGNVRVDGNYKKVKKLKQDFFIDPHGVKYFFSKTKPEDYYR
jgi:hypothetical protein